MISFSAFSFADRIFCFSLRLSSSRSFRLWSLSARSIDRLSLYLSSFYKICPHSLPRLHLSFKCLFYSWIVISLYFSLFFCSSNNDMPCVSSSYLSSIITLLCYRNRFLQICRPCFIPFLMLLLSADNAILTPSSFLWAYSSFTSFSYWQ